MLVINEKEEVFAYDNTLMYLRVGLNDNYW